jgi:predicted TIM-barrel fold metal-dependent hydrolase
VASNRLHAQNPYRDGISRRQWLSTSAAATVAAAVGPALCSADGTAAESNLRIWDNHCHLSGIEGDTPAEKMTAMLPYANRMGIERLVIYMGWPFSQDPDSAELIRQNNQVLAALEGHEDRVLAYAYVSGNHPDESIAEMRRLIEKGPMLGIKLWVARRCDDKALDAIATAATDLNAVIFQHTWIKTTGNLPGESTPEDMAKLAARHPQGKFICGHAGGSWEQGIRAIRAYENILLGTAGCDPTAGLVEMAVRELGAERVVFGSDAAGRSFASQLAKVLGTNLTEEQKRIILGGNLRRILTPIMNSKGMQVG